MLAQISSEFLFYINASSSALPFMWVLVCILGLGYLSLYIERH